MNKGSVLLFVMLLLASTQADLATANKNQKFNSTSGCGCHGGAGGVNAVLNGLPSTYTPGGTYSLSVSMSGSPLSGGFNLGVNKGVCPTQAAQPKLPRTVCKRPTTRGQALRGRLTGRHQQAVQEPHSSTSPCCMGTTVRTPEATCTVHCRPA